MTYFTMGPVEMYPETLQIEGSQPLYFRTEEFGAKMKECERMFLQSVNAPEDACYFPLCCSGTGAMDAVISNLFTEKNRVLVIDGGSFGHRFFEICEHYGVPTDRYVIAFREAFSPKHLERYADGGYTALLVNACDTSTGQKYDLDYLGNFCRQNHMLLVVDAVSAYLADEIDMTRQGIDVLFTASQKALALSPGAALVALSAGARERVNRNRAPYYFDFNAAIDNQRRGQTPFTCPAGTMLALHQRLSYILETGIKETVALHARRAAYFREKVARLPVEIPEIPLSNCCTPLLFPKENARSVFENLKNRYGLVLTPSGGEWKNKQLRVGHLGNLGDADFDLLICKLEEELRT